VKRRFRVREDRRFREIRGHGRAYSSDLLVLCALANDLSYSRFGFAVNSRIGNAVVRNRIKRRLREGVRIQVERIRPGWDIILIARRPIRSADYHQMEAACARLFRRAHLFVESEAAAGDRVQRYPDEGGVAAPEAAEHGAAEKLENGAKHGA
jgi:ribonuclease P protein component